MRYVDLISQSSNVNKCPSTGILTEAHQMNSLVSCVSTHGHKGNLKLFFLIMLYVQLVFTLFT